MSTPEQIYARMMRQPTELGYDPDTMALDGLPDAAPTMSPFIAGFVSGAVIVGALVAAILTGFDRNVTTVAKTQDRLPMAVEATR